MNRIGLALLALLLAVSPSAVAAEYAIPELDIKERELPDTEGIRFVAGMKLGWNLGNTFDAFSDTAKYADELDTESSWCGVKTTPEMLKAIKDAGFGTIRIPVTWHNHLTDDNFTISERWLERVKEVVAQSLEQGLRVIINIHHDTRTGFYYPSKEHLETSEAYMAAIWSQLAEAFKDYGDMLIFESINEPRLINTPFEWNLVSKNKSCDEAVECVNRLNQVFVDTVRKSGGNNETRYLMVPGYCASLQGATHALFEMPTDSAKDRLILSVHAYTPYNFALQDPNERGSKDTFSIGSKTDTYEIEHLMSSLYDKYVSKGVPVVIGEFGSRGKGMNLQSRIDHAAFYIASAHACGITCCWWDNNAFAGNGELFGLFLRSRLKWSPPQILSAMIKYAE